MSHGTRNSLSNDSFERFTSPRLKSTEGGAGSQYEPDTDSALFDEVHAASSAGDTGQQRRLSKTDVDRGSSSFTTSPDSALPSLLTRQPLPASQSSLQSVATPVDTIRTPRLQRHVSRVYKEHSRFHIPEGTAIFVVQGVSFRIHAYFLERDSSFFRKTLLDNDPSHPMPYFLSGIWAVDFERFLTVPYPLSFSERDEATTFEEWKSILKLATLWKFDSIRTLAIRALSSDSITTPVDRLLLGRRYQVPQWIYPAFAELVRREDYLSDAEAGRLGWVDTLGIFRARELLRRPCRPGSDKFSDYEVREVLRTTLHSALEDLIPDFEGLAIKDPDGLKPCNVEDLSSVCCHPTCEPVQDCDTYPRPHAYDGIQADGICTSSYAASVNDAGQQVRKTPALSVQDDGQAPCPGCSLCLHALGCPDEASDRRKHWQEWDSVESSPPTILFPSERPTAFESEDATNLKAEVQETAVPLPPSPPASGTFYYPPLPPNSNHGQEDTLSDSGTIKQDGLQGRFARFALRPNTAAPRRWNLRPKREERNRARSLR